MQSATLQLPQSVNLTSPGANPAIQGGTEQRGFYTGWIVFVFAGAVDVDTVINLRDLSSANLICNNRTANRVLSWKDTEHPPVFATIDAIIINSQGLDELNEDMLQRVEDAIEVRSQAGGLDQSTRLGFGALGASPRQNAGVADNASGIITKRPGSAELVRGVLPRPITVDYQGADFTLQFGPGEAGASFPFATPTIAMHGTWATKGIGAGIVLVNCDGKSGNGTPGPTADDVGRSVLITQKTIAGA